MRVPKSIMVAGRKCNIKYLDTLPAEHDSEPLMGDSSSDSMDIRINKGAHKSSLQVQRTIFHELIHIALGMTGHAQWLETKQEEALAHALENMLSDSYVFSTTAAIKWCDEDFDFEDD